MLDSENDTGMSGPQGPFGEDAVEVDYDAITKEYAPLEDQAPGDLGGGITFDVFEHVLLTQRIDLFLHQVVSMIHERRILEVAPRYQRRVRWSASKKSRLIESLLMNIPLPPLFLYEYELSRYEVMDGRQRLSAISEYMANKLRLSGLRVFPHLNGKTFERLPGALQDTLNRRTVSATILILESGTKATERSMKLRQQIFDRLNTGGTSLNPQEIRNALYDGELNSMLHRVSRSDIFTEVWNIPPKEEAERYRPSQKLLKNKYYATMADCAIVLRFFALEDADSYASPRKALDDYMRTNARMAPSRAASLEESFLDCIGFAFDLYGENTFRTFSPRKPNPTGSLSVPFSDAVMAACRKHMPNREVLIERKALVVAKTLESMRDKTKYDAMIGSKNSRDEFKERLSIVDGIFSEVVAD